MGGGACVVVRASTQKFTLTAGPSPPGCPSTVGRPLAQVCHDNGVHYVLFSMHSSRGELEAALALLDPHAVVPFCGEVDDRLRPWTSRGREGEAGIKARMELAVAAAATASSMPLPVSGYAHLGQSGACAAAASHACQRPSPLLQPPPPPLSKPRSSHSSLEQRTAAAASAAGVPSHVARAHTLPAGPPKYSFRGILCPPAVPPPVALQPAQPLTATVSIGADDPEAGAAGMSCRAGEGGAAGREEAEVQQAHHGPGNTGERRWGLSGSSQARSATGTGHTLLAPAPAPLCCTAASGILLGPEGLVGAEALPACPDPAPSGTSFSGQPAAGAAGVEAVGAASASPGCGMSMRCMDVVGMGVGAVIVAGVRAEVGARVPACCEPEQDTPKAKVAKLEQPSRSPQDAMIRWIGGYDRAVAIW